MNKKQLIIKDNYSITSPSQLQGMAMVLRQHILDNKLFTTIVGKNYVHVEGWQFAGGLLGTTPRIISVINLSTSTEIKWQAQVEIVEMKTGNIVSTGYAICSNKEQKKKTFDEYAVLSMAQTRAIGKAYRNVIGWVIKLAGYESAPAEEMTYNNVEKEKVNDVKTTTKDVFDTTLKYIKQETNKERLRQTKERIFKDTKIFNNQQKVKLMQSINEKLGFK